VVSGTDGKTLELTVRSSNNKHFRLLVDENGGYIAPAEYTPPGPPEP
jgi:hypothetical protein